MPRQIHTRSHAFLVLGMLMGFIAAVLMSGTAQAQTLDHYKCYKAKEIKKRCTGDLVTKCKTDGDCATAGGTCFLGFPKQVTVDLADQFESKPFDLKKPKLFCAPVDKNGEGIADPNTHFVGFLIKNQTKQGQPKHIKTTLLSRDQYGDMILETIKEFYLFVPAAKNPGPPPECGDGVVNQPTEDCDPPDDSACPGQCQLDCTCPASCPEDGSPDACLAYTNEPRCTLCCSHSPDCLFYCGRASDEFCGYTDSNWECAFAINTVGCAPKCCP